MTRRAAGALFLWLLAMLAGTAVVANSRFVTDMSFFLPTRPSAEQQVLVDQLKDSVVSRLLMVAVEGGTAAQRAALSRELRARLARLPEFASVRNGEAGSFDADREFLFRQRYLLSPAVSAERFSVDGLRAAIGNSIDLLASPAGMMFKAMLPRDPTGEFLELISGLDTGAQPATLEGVWMSRDGARALLLVEPRALGSDTDGQELAVQRVQQEFSEAGRTLGATQLSLAMSGPGLFAVQSRATIKREVSRLSVLTTIVIVALLFYVYRSPRLLALGLLPVASGALAGIVIVSLAFGSVFGITVGFGSALIGEAVDYSIYYFIQSARLGAETWRSRFWPTIRLGMLTSVAGFGALTLAGFPGLSQLGLYALSGLVVAALVTRYLLPLVAGANLGMRELSGVGKGLQRFFARLPALRRPALALALAATVFLALQSGSLWHPDISALSTIGEAESALDLKLREDLGAPDSRYLVVVTASSQEQALQAAEQVGRILDTLIEPGAIGGYDTPARFLPSRATQAARRASLPEGAELARRLPAALADAPLSPRKLADFIADVERARHAADLERPALDGTNLALAVDSLLMQRAGTWSVVMPLRPSGDGQGGIVAGEPIRAALASVQGALFIDMKQEFNRLYDGYMREAVLLSLGGLGAIVVLLALALRSPRQLAAVMLPLLMALVIVVAALHLAGERLHLLHLVGMLLIVAVGSNYALFFNRNDDGITLSTLTSMVVACLTTAVGFGTLALSKVPVLHAIGVTVGPGAVLALLLSAAFARVGAAR